MVFDVGIDVIKSNALAFDEETKELLYFEIIKIDSFSFDNKINYFFLLRTIKKLFRKIKCTLGGKLGCACICLWDECDNKLLKNIHQQALEHGFTNVQLIDSRSAIYFDAVYQTGYAPEVNDVICVFANNYCHIWKRYKEKTKLLSALYYSSEDFFENEMLIKIEPTIILYKKTETSIKKILNIPYKMFQPQSYCWGALVKAEIMSGKASLQELNAQPFLSKNILVTLEDELIEYFTQFQSLPVTKSFLHEKNQCHLKITDGNKKEKIHIPKSEKSLILFKIDVNGIYSVTIKDFSPSSKNTEDIDSFYCDAVRNLRRGNNLINYSVPKPVNFDKSEIISATGITFGASNCCVAVNRRSGFETVSLDNTGERLLPSYVAFDETHEKCGKIVVDRLWYQEKTSVFDIAKIIGKMRHEVDIEENWPFYVVDNGNRIKLQIQGINNPLFKFPEEILAILFKHIKQKVEEFQGKICDKVVITVPDGFMKAQYHATYVAASIANWKTIDFLPNSIAIIFGYFTKIRLPEYKKILVFDMGGTSLNMSILEIQQKTIFLKYIKCDPTLGCRAFDEVLYAYFYKTLSTIFIKSHKLMSTLSNKKHKLLSKCQEIKHNLSIVERVTLDIQDFDPSIDIFIPISQKKFNILTADLLWIIKKYVLSFLSESHTRTFEVKRVLLAGGGCRMSMIKNLLQDMFIDAVHHCPPNPDEIAAVGAAHYAYTLKQ